MKCTYMYVHMNELLNAHYIILEGIENNNDLCWIAKRVWRLNRIDSRKSRLVTSYRLEYLLFQVSDHLRVATKANCSQVNALEEHLLCVLLFPHEQ